MVEPTQARTAPHLIVGHFSLGSSRTAQGATTAAAMTTKAIVPSMAIHEPYRVHHSLVQSGADRPTNPMNTEIAIAMPTIVRKGAAVNAIQSR